MTMVYAVRVDDGEVVKEGTDHEELSNDVRRRRLAGQMTARLVYRARNGEWHPTELTPLRAYVMSGHDRLTGTATMTKRGGG